MTKSTRKVLRFKNGQETYPTILTKEELSDSPFSYSVNSALSHIEDLYNGLKDIEEKNFSDFKYRIPNNIIAFLGNRGTGKTSCMRTATGICKAEHKDWLILDEIDPSFFDENHNILDIFIGALYGLYKKETTEWDKLSRDSQDNLRRINDSFRKVKSALRYVKDNLKFDDEYETDELRHLDEGVRLRQLLNDLIAGFLKYKGKKFLVVSIDDLDLNISCSYEMLEQLRKYLILPNVAIIIAARFDQLFDNICLVLTRHYKDIPARVSQKDVAEMAERYLNKVLPLSHRCEMPSADSYMDAVILFDGEEDEPQKDSERLVSVRVPALIFRKTRYLFYNTAGIPSLVIPRNLRDLRMLVSMLKGMKDYTDEDKTNQKVFKDYFFKEWMGIIEPEYRPFIKRLLEEEDLSKLNRMVVSNLYELFLKDTEPVDRLAQEIKEVGKQNVDTNYTRRRKLLYNILNPRNSYWNVSLGDVVVIMNAVRANHDSAKILSLLFVVTTFYSIRLYETYNLMTNMTNENGLAVPIEKAATNPELKTSVRADIPSYFRLVGGAFFTGSGDSFIPMGQNDKEQREARIINAGFLIPEIRSVVKEYQNLKNSKSGQATARLKGRLRMCEFFMLTVTNRIDLKRSIDHRLINEPLYFVPFGTSAKNLVFDVTRPFFSCVYPKLSYDRFNREIYDVALNEEDSILSKMLELGKSRDKDNDTWGLMSKAAIRNMEILEDLTAWMSHNRDNIRPAKGGLPGAIADYFDKFEVIKKDEVNMPAKGYCVKTYYRHDKDIKSGEEIPYYLIDYSVYSVLEEFLKELDESSLPSDATDEWKENCRELRNTFDTIMSENDILILRQQYDKEEVREALYPLCGHSVVDFALGRDDGEISLTDLSLCLAEITVEHRFDFTGRLPKELEFYYRSATMTNYSSKVEHLRESRIRLEDAVSDANESIRARMDDVKMLKKEKAQLGKQIVDSEKEYNKTSGEITAAQNELILLNVSKTEELTKTQISAIEKKRETMMKKINSLEGKKEETNANISMYRKHLQEVDVKIRDLEDAIKHFNQTIRKNEREIKKVDAQIERLNTNFNNRMPV